VLPLLKYHDGQHDLVCTLLTDKAHNPLAKTITIRLSEHGAAQGNSTV